MEAFETFEVDGLTVELHHDDGPSSPADWDNLGTLLQWHRHYGFGDRAEGVHLEALERGGPRLLARYLTLCEGAIGLTSVGMIDHSGIALYPGGGAHACDPGGWDSGTVGFMYTTAARVRELCGDDPKFLDPKFLDDAMRADLSTWDAYVRGNVIGYIVRDEHGTVVDSCWGFYPDDDGDGFDYVRAEARDIAQGYAETEQAERARAAAMDVATVTP